MSRARIDGRAVREAAQDPESFARCRRRLESAIDATCVPGRPWPAAVAAAIRSALEFADTDPVAARVIAIHSAPRRFAGEADFAELTAELAGRLGAGAPAVAWPERTAHNLVTRVARQALLQLETPAAAPPSTIAPDLIVFVLTPYVGLSEAQRWAGWEP